MLPDFDPARHDGTDIRAWLTEDDIEGTDKRVRYVTLKAYEKAGGTVRRDLFSQDDDGVFILDVPLLDKLVSEKLDRAAKAAQKEGWKWVEVRSDFDYQAKSQIPYPPRGADAPLRQEAGRAGNSPEGIRRPGREMDEFRRRRET